MPLYTVHSVQWYGHEGGGAGIAHSVQCTVHSVEENFDFEAFSEKFGEKFSHGKIHGLIYIHIAICM